MNDGTALTLESSASRAEQVYLALRDLIVEGKYPPGARLRERELAEVLGVSRVPLREALPLLEADGFITTSLRRGASVIPLTVRDVEELFDVRLGVDVYATRLAARQAAAGASTRGLTAALERADLALVDGDFARITDANADLHDEIVRLAGNSLLSAMMRPISGRARWIFHLTAHPEPTLACREHHDLCAAICSGNADLAAALAHAHIEGGRRPTIEALAAVLPAR